MQFIILLRGVNVGGKNRVPMSELKQHLTNAGFVNARSHINSGNLIVESEKDSEQVVLEKCQKILSDHFSFPIEVVIISADKYQKELASIPSWWGENELYKHNALFLLPSVDKKGISKLSSMINENYEKIYIGELAIFWSSSFKENYSKTYYSKLIGNPLYKQVTIRNRNTTLKLSTFL
ncbi:DUF1697 domain-containing protein [Carnobacterium sp. 17-4]|uniref:DUF1697 domain-containing protein n=1 Tax=Carnobacterium sp. (strain 17-4) TaxID=208596 RepID=UPI00031EA66F|nr:DUF1697 domain-containing protein [Carnobacterium sp. 17-4]